MDLRTFVVLALLGVSGTLAAPTDTSRCAGECTQVYNPKFDYSPGKTYTYAYESSTALKLAGVTSDEPGLKLAANAEISVLTPCEFALKLSNVRLSGPKNVPQAAEFKKIVEERPLLFSFTDGRVNHVCPDPKDPTWSVNLKRGVLSTFQNTMDKNLETFVREVDIAGQCDTQYEVTATTGKSSTVNKRKELATCTKRVGRITSLQGNPYASYSRVQSPPLTKSSQNCVHVIANNIIQSVECEELHVLRLFARGELGATSTSRTKLTYLKQAKGSAKNLPRKVAESSLLFDHSEDAAKLTNDVEEAIALLMDICEKTKNDLNPSSATDFTRLVYLIKRLPVDSIRRIDANIPLGKCSNPKARSTFLSAVNQAGTEASVQVVVDWLNSNRITGVRARAWITSLAFIQRPTSGTIEAVIPLIDSPNPNRIALLSASSIVHTFCRRNDQCEKDKSVQKFIEKLGRHLGHKCEANNPEEEDKIIASLKAFGNIGHFGKFLTVIQDCAKNPELNITIRLAAIDAFRRASYDENTNRLLLRILEDQTQDTELRIASYLAVMRHPCSDSIQKIKWILDKEIINQVNTFIWTHLKNLQKSKSPVKHDIRKLVKNISLERKFVDGRKFSKNYGASFYSDKLNAGGAVDGNIIFTPESFLPRSASLNLTVDLFGYSIDLLEVDIRAVNLEHHWEKYFGPTGKLSGKSDEELQSTLRDRWLKISQDIENEARNSKAHRHRREAVQNSAKYKSLVSEAALRRRTKAEGSLSLKVFGNEIRWYDFHRIEDLYDREDPYNLKDIFNTLATHKELDVVHNAMFLDTTSTIPTASGFPLRLDLNGTASVALKLVSHFDIRKFLLSPRFTDIKSLIQPSTSIELAGSLIIDAGVVKTGLKLASNAYSSTAIDGTLLIKEGEITAKLDLPKETQDLIKVKSNLYVVDNDKETPVTPISTTRYELQGCTKRIGSLIGVELCTVVSLPRPLINPQRPYLPLGGSLEYGVSLRKTNPEFQGYHFTAVSTSASSSEFNFKISFNTPGSTRDREYTIEYVMQQGKQLRLNVRTPYKKVQLSGDFNDGGSTREANLVMKVDDEREYAFHGKTGVVRQGDTTIFTPTWEITRPNTPKVVLTGTIKRTPMKKLEIDIKDAPSSERKPYLIKGNFELEGDSPNKIDWEGEFELVTPDLQNKWSASFEREDSDSEYKGKIDINYETQRKGEEKRAFSLKLRRETKIDHNGYKFYRFAEWKLARLPDYNGKIAINIEHEKGEWEHVLDGRWGPNFEDESKSFHFEHRHELKRVGAESFNGKGSLKILYPRRNVNVDLQSKLNYQIGRLVDYNLALKYGQDKTVKLSFEYKNQSARLLKHSGELKIEVPSREIIIRDSIEEKEDGEFVGATYIQWQRGESLTIDSSYKSKEAPGLYHRELEIVASLNKQQIRKYSALYHKENGKFQLNLKVAKPDKTYLVNIERVKTDPSQSQLEVTLNLPWIEGTAKGKRNTDQVDATFDFKTERRRVVGSVNIKSSHANTLNLDLKWDADRDPNKKVNLVVKLERRQIRYTSIKTVTNLPNRVIKADFVFDLPETLFNGDHHITSAIEYAPGKNLNVDAKFNIDKNQEARRVSHGVVSINKGLPDEITIDYNTDYQKLPEERRFNAHFDISRGGPERDLVLTINHVRGDQHLDTSVELKKVGNNDAAFKVGLVGDWDLGSVDGFIMGGGLELKTPLEGPLSDFAIVIREGLKRSPDSADLVHENRLRLGKGNEFGALVEWKRRSPSHTGLEYSASVQLDTPFESMRLYKLGYELIVQRGAPFIISAKAEAAIGTERSFISAFRYDLIGTKANAYLLLDSSRVPGAFEITLTSYGDIRHGKQSSEVTIKYGDGNVIRYVRHLTISKERSDLQMVITSPSEVAPTIKVTANLRRPNEKQAVIDSYVEWGEDKYLEATGQLNLNVENEFSGKVKVNSIALGLADVSVSATGKAVGTKKTLDLKFNFGPDRDIDIHASRDLKPGNDGSVGELAVKINNEDFLAIKTDYQDTLSRKSPVGRLIALRTEVHNPMISAAIHFIASSEKGVNPTVKICTLDLNKCIILETLIDRAADDEKLGPIDSTYYAKVIVQRAPTDTRTVGIIATSKKLRNTVERSVKIAWNEEEKKFIGLNFVSERTGDANKPGFNRKYQILLPSRTIEARSDKTSNDKGYVYNLNLLLDATREPDRKLSINVDAKVTSSGGSWTRISRITVKHPELKNDLLITNELRVNQDRIIFAQKTEFDLTGKKVTVDIEIIDVNKSPNGFNYTYLLGIRQSAAKNLDLKIRGHRAKTDEGRTFGHELVWLNKDGVPKSYSIFSEIDKVNHVINGVIRTPIRQFDWKGTYEKLEPNGLHGVRADLDFNYNNKLVRRAHIEYSSRPSINLKYYSNPADINRLFRLHGGLLDEENFELSATRVKDGQTIEDLSLLVHLNSSRMLFNRLKWRPGIVQSIREGIDSRTSGLSNAVEEAVQNFAELAKSEVSDKSDAIRSVLKTQVAPVLASIGQRLAAAHEELQKDLEPGKLDRLKDVLEALFSNFVDVDALIAHIQTIRQQYRDNLSARLARLSEILSRLGGTLDGLVDKLVNVLATLPERIQAWRANARSRLPELLARIGSIAEKIHNNINEFLQDQYVSKGIALFREVWDNTVAKAHVWLQSTGSFLGGRHWLDDDNLDVLYEKLKTKLYEYSEQEGELPKVVKGILTAIRTVKERIREIIEGAFQALREYRDALLSSWSDIYNEYQNNPDFQALVEELRVYREQLREKYLKEDDDDDDDKKSYKTQVREVTDKVVLRLRERLAYLVGKDGVWDPANGLIEYYIPLVAPIESLRELRQGFSLRRLFEQEDKQSLKQALKNALDRLKPKLTPEHLREIIPPFDGQALLIGEQHYMTFDGRFYDFAGECSYVLTQDLVDHNFSVIVSNGKDNRGLGLAEKESILVISDFHNILIKIKPELKVTLDDQVVELPVQIEKTVVWRKGDTIQVDNNKGFTVIYDDDHNLVSVNISGYYFGKVGGLFGNYNNEPSDDFRTPDGRNLTSTDQFVNSWQVSDSCPSQKNLAWHALAPYGSEPYDECHKIFTSMWSPLEDCFDTVNTDHFLQVCLEETSYHLTAAGGNLCNVIGAYIHTCEHHNIKLRTPAMCLICTSPDGIDYNAREKLSLMNNNVPRSADVMFIIEQKVCNRPILVESMDELARELDRELQDVNGLHDNRYGVVAFGGEGSHEHAHTHTARGQLFNDARSVVLALKNMAFSGTKPGDAFGAIDLAARYPFRPGVAKIGILFLCSRCSETSQSVDYSELQHRLLDTGFTLHALIPEEFKMKSKSQLASLIIGIDAQSTYKGKDIAQKNLIGEADLRSHLTGIKDLCFTLAQEVGGSVFRSDLFETGKSNVGKNVKGVFVRRVAANAEPAQCQTCSCENLNFDGVGHQVCRPCTAPKPHTLYGFQDDSEEDENN